MNIQITALIVGLALSIAIFELLRRKALREKYAVVWLGAGLFVIVGALFPTAIEWLSSTLGFNVMSNFILAGIGITLLVVVMHMSLEIGTLEDKVQTLAEETALLKFELKNLQDND